MEGPRSSPISSAYALSHRKGEGKEHAVDRDEKVYPEVSKVTVIRGSAAGYRSNIL